MTRDEVKIIKFLDNKGNLISEWELDEIPVAVPVGTYAVQVVPMCTHNGIEDASNCPHRSNHE